MARSFLRRRDYRIRSFHRIARPVSLERLAGRHVRIGSPLFTHTLFGLYLGLMVWGGLWLRDRNLQTLIPFRR